MKKIIKAAFFTLTVLFLSGCGGGSWNGGDNSYPLQAAFIDSITSSSQYNFTLSGTIAGASISGAGVEVNSVLTPAIFLGESCGQQTSSATGSYTQAGVVIPFNKVSFACYDINYDLLGTTGSEFLIVTDFTPLPDYVYVGDSGPYYTGETYSDGTFTIQTGTKTASVSILDGTTSDSALVSLSIVNYSLNGAVVSSTTKLFNLYTDGTLYPVSSSTVSGAETVITSYQ